MSGAGLAALLLLGGPSQPVAELFQYHCWGGADIFNTSANYISFQILYTTDIYICIGYSASKISIRRFIIKEKAPTRAFCWLKAATTAFTFKTLLRHYAKRALTPRSLNVKLVWLA